MCGSYSPEYQLAKILERHFGTSVTPSQAKSLIADHWSKISVLSHAIHDSLQASKERQQNLESAAQALERAGEHTRASEIRSMLK